MSPRASLLQRRVATALDPEMAGGGLSRTNAIVIVLILCSSLAVILETEPAMVEGRERWFRAIALMFAGIFALEYAARLWAAPTFPRYAGVARPRLRYLLSPWSIIDLAAIVPALFLLVGHDWLLLRMLRLVRLAAIGRFSRSIALIGLALYRRRIELLITLLGSLGMMLVAAVALYLVEGEGQPEAFGSIPRALWWSVITLTTVGYGDAAPLTAAGRTLAAFVAIIGIGLIALPTGIFASAFSDALQERHQQDRGMREHAAGGSEQKTPEP